MLKEEHVLFPMIQQFEETSRSAGPGAGARFRHIEFPIARILAEHALYQGLPQFEQYLHQHIHLENKTLFPRAVALTEAGQELYNVV